MNTAQIIGLIETKLRTLLSFKPNDFEEFESWYREVEVQTFAETLTEYLPIRQSVLKLVYKNLFGCMPFEKEYVLKNYLHDKFGLKYLIYPSNKPKRLLVLFSGFINRVTFNRYSWYWDPTEKWEQDSVYLFLNDPTCHWYVGAKGEDALRKYSAIILETLDFYGLKQNQLHTCGASMGGYAAILYGLKLQAKSIISVHPQFSIKNAQRYVNSTIWSNKIYECGNQFIDLDDVVACYKHRPNLYLEISQNPADVVGVESFINEYMKNQSLILARKTNEVEHETKSPSLELINDLINLFEKS